MTATAAYTPNGNGVNAVVDRMVEMMTTADRKLKPEVALAWFITAVNSLENHKGFSPAQLVFGKNPTHPTLMAAGPSGMEEVEVSANLASHIHAMQAARKAYIKCESDRVLAEALRRRVYLGAGEIRPGMWVYYKQGRRWQGTVKIHSVDGKKVYAVRAGKLLTLNKDDIVLAKSVPVSP